MVEKITTNKPLREKLETDTLSLARPRQWQIIIETKPEAVATTIMKNETLRGFFSHAHPYMTLKNGPSNLSYSSTTTNQQYSTNNHNEQTTQEI